MRPTAGQVILLSFLTTVGVGVAAKHFNKRIPGYAG